ncbi:MAG: acetyl-CoA carboxylase carboxyltransferase subunit [Leptonema illini]|jgi:acetyl-CoA carboxylase carboxyltransferase component|uniref:Acetyl-CoA carboxylase carboxyltransferase subunit n=1 Tax=Leptonema illini TaxID=183 RepID=A0A833LZ28_9LEPT|nr:MAG: acetyl-CoA carboxylase carboxyltransferase subunit [Leptonema illini]PKL32882.1 MAG: acetyl-CoA carboxylase carboxyltransferase subunit [Spirochaetae bacterium HGW-Spirochaetae-10]
MTLSLKNPFRPEEPPAPPATPYDRTLDMGKDLIEKPLRGGGPSRIQVQHSKNRMTVFERIQVLTKERPHYLFQNWGPHLDGAGLVTAILNIDGRDVALYGHDFTNRAGSMDATNGGKLARLIYMAGEKGIPLIGMNDSAGAYVPAGVGGLDGYSEAFCALRKISGVVPSIMMMFGFNAGGGSYLPRQGSFMIQPQETFFGLTGPQVVKDVLGEEVTPDELGGPSVHSQSGVVDIIANDELSALRRALRLLNYIPDNNHSLAPFHSTSDSIDRYMYEEEILFRKTFNSPTGFNTPFDMTLLIQNIVDHGEFFELQKTRARNLITAFGRIGGHVVGIMANNSAVASGQIDINAALKGARFTRFCNLYNIPMIFFEDTTGFLPGREQESGGIVQAGRALLDSIIDLRTPRFLVIVRNAFGGAYATFNSYHVGADMVFTFPTARVAVMGPAGKEFVYKDELRAARAEAKKLQAAGKNDEAKKLVDQISKQLSDKYEEDLMNPKEALALGSISQVILPGESRRVIGNYLNFYMKRYKPTPLSEPQREFH